MNFLRLLSSSTAYLGLSYVLRFVLTLSLAKLLSSTELGIYSWALTAFGLLSIFVNFGQDNFLLRKIPEEKNNDETSLGVVVGFSFRLVLRNCLIIIPSTYLFLYIFSEFLETPEYSKPLILLSFALPFGAFTLINASILRTNDKPLLAQVPDSIIQPGVLLIFVFTIYFFTSIELNAQYFVVFNLLGWILAFGFSLWASKFFFSKYRPNLNRVPFYRKWHNDSSTILLGVLAWSLLGRSDVFFLAFLVTPDQVGFYFISMRLAEFTLFFATVSFYIWSGEISNLYQRRKFEEVQLLLRKSSRLCFGTSLIFFFFSIYFAEEILILVNEEYASNVLLFKISLLGFLVLGCAGILGPMFYIVGDIKYLTRLQFSIGFVFLLMIFITVPFYGILGSAISFVICQVFYIAFMAFRLKSRFKFTISPF